MNTKKVKIWVNVIIFVLLAVFVVLALIIFAMLGEGERVNLPAGRPSPVASPQ
jgi:hypothetical protein